MKRYDNRKLYDTQEKRYVLPGELAAPRYEAGLRRINIHLDTLDRRPFVRNTRRNERERLLRGTDAPAAEYRFADGAGTIGFIASVSRPFCLQCNRIRLTADGKLRYCLFALEETDVKGLLRGGASDEEIAATIRETVRAKWLGHEINSSRFVPPPRPMYAIGG
jgi:molybdenum cofactor biosynthesis enzyme MoaA